MPSQHLASYSASQPLWLEHWGYCRNAGNARLLRKHNITADVEVIPIQKVKCLEYEKENSAREFQQVNNQIIMMRKTRDSTRLECESEMERLRHVQQERMKQEAIVKHFENNNEVYYIKIRKTAEEKVVSILSNSKMLLKLALLSLTLAFEPVTTFLIFYSILLPSDFL